MVNFPFTIYPWVNADELPRAQALHVNIYLTMFRIHLIVCERFYVNTERFFIIVVKDKIGKD